MAISFSDYSKICGYSTQGRAHKNKSDMIMDATWFRDIQAQTAYIYDYYHDLQSDEQLKLDDLHPDIDNYKTPLDIKFIRHAKQTYDKDQVTFWIQMRPKQECNLDYYDEVLGNRYDALFPIGCYIDILHDDNKFHKWLIVDKANWNGNQFPTFEILKCDKVFQWIHDGKKYQCAGVLRSQNSYNSGLWTDYKITTVEDQQKFAVPMTRDTETLFYNHRIIIDAKVETEPRVWLISKVNRISPNGVCRITLTQDTFNQHADYIEHDDNGNIIGMWADYYKSSIEPIPIKPDDQSGINIVISCSGKHQLKIGGSAKTLTVSFIDVNGEQVEFQSGDWLFAIDGEDVSALLTLTSVSDNKIKIEFNGDDSYINKILTATFTSGDISSSLDLEILPL